MYYMKNKLFKILFCISISVFFIAAAFFGVYAYRNYIKNPPKSTVTVSEPSVSSEVELPDNPIDFKKLKKKNSDIYAWIKIPGTSVDYAVLQSYADDDNFYLNHDEDKNWSAYGSIYTQRANSTDFSDRNTVIYGHNMLNGSMFASLHKFREKEFFDENKYIYIYTPNHILKYKIFAAYKYDDRHILNSFDFDDDKVWREYLDFVENPKSVIKNTRDVELKLTDKIITLSTCIGNEDTARYLVQGVLIKDVETK